MTLNYVTLILDGYNGSGAQLTSGFAQFTPTVALTDPADGQFIPPAPVQGVFRAAGGPPQVSLLATDNGNVTPSGWGWTVTFSGVPGNPASFSFFLPFASGATQHLSALSPVSSAVTMQGYLPLPSGTPSSGQVPVATGSGEASAWGTISSGVTSVFGRTGAVTAQSGDYTAAQVGADASGAAATAQAASLQKSANLSDVANAATARTNLGLGSYPDQLPAVEYALQGASGITALYAAIANRNNARVDIPIIGDSITEGYGSTAFTNRYINQLNRAIRAAYPTTVNGASGGLGFIPIQESGGLSTYTWPVTLAAGTPGAALLGPVRFCTQCTTAGTSWTWTAPAGTTSVKIMYFDRAQAGSFTYQVGAGATTTVNNASSNSDLLTSSIAITGGQVLTIAYVSGTVYLDGIMHYAGDETSGITFDGCGHYGWTVTNWTQAGVGINWYPVFNTFTPAAFGIMLGVNDATAVTAAQFQSNLGTFLSNLRGDVSPGSAMTKVPVLLIACYQPNETFTDPGGWPAYVAAMRAVAAADTVGAHVIDLSYRMPSVASNFNGGTLYHDVVHPSDLGHALIGEIASAGVRIA